MTNNDNFIKVAVCGAHMSGLSLNHQLLNLQSEFVSKEKTAPFYKLYKLPGFEPPRPGLVRVHTDGHAIELEVWQIPLDKYGIFVAGIPSPLGIGTLDLENGESLQGFLCEGFAVSAAEDISNYGGWRNFLENYKPS